MNKQKLSLQDQLLKSGLVTSAHAKTVKADKNKQAKQQRHHKAASVDEAKVLADKAQAEKIQRDRELNQLKNQQEEKKQIAAQIKQIIEANRYDLDDDGVAYKFIDNNRVKTIYVSDNMRNQIASGALAIVKLNQRYEVVSAEAADKIKARDEKYVILLNDKLPANDGKDDPYAGYQVPDDLMW